MRETISAIYADLQTEIDARKPQCDASGRCCRFDEYGHRLYVTTLELAAFVAARPGDGGEHRGTSLPLFRPGGACRYQIDGLCSVHKIRPFGCRIYFCDPAAQTWQQELYEVTHLKLKREHERLGVPYFYVEWRAALREIEGLLLDAIPPTLNNAKG